MTNKDCTNKLNELDILQVKEKLKREHPKRTFIAFLFNRYVGQMYLAVLRFQSNLCPCESETTGLSLSIINHKKWPSHLLYQTEKKKTQCGDLLEDTTTELSLTHYSTQMALQFNSRWHEASI